MISVVVPIYNSEATLKATIDSILAQTHKDFELLLIDDGSTDDSVKICNAYADADSRIKVSLKNFVGGVAAARNRGIDLAQGDHISFVDSDDIIHPRMLEILYDEIIKTHSDISICNIKKVSSAEEIEYAKTGYETQLLTSTAQIFQTASYRMSMCGRLYKSALVKAHKIALNAHSNEDVTYNIELLVSNHLKVCLIKQDMYFYVNNRSSLTHTVTKDSQLPACLHLLELYQHGQKVIHKEYLLEFMAKTFILLRYQMSRDSSSDESRQKCACYIKQLYPVYRKDSKSRKKALMLLFLKVPFLYQIYMGVCRAA